MIMTWSIERSLAGCLSDTAERFHHQLVQTAKRQMCPSQYFLFSRTQTRTASSHTGELTCTYVVTVTYHISYPDR
jgi:hypothetical protein